MVRKTKGHKGRKHRKGGHRKPPFGRTSLVNTRFAQIHHLPMSSKYFTTLESTVNLAIHGGVTLASGSIVVVPTQPKPYIDSSPPIAINFALLQPLDGSLNATYAGFTQLGAIYNYYRMLATKIEVVMVPGENNGGDTVQLAMAPYTSTYTNRGVAVYPYLFDLQKAPWGKSNTMNLTTSSATRKNQLTLYYKNKELYGVPQTALMSEDNYAGFTDLTKSGVLDPVNVQISWTCASYPFGGGAGTFADNGIMSIKIKSWFCFDNVNTQIGS